MDGQQKFLQEKIEHVAYWKEMTWLGRQKLVSGWLRFEGGATKGRQSRIATLDLGRETVKLTTSRWQEV